MSLHTPRRAPDDEQRLMVLYALHHLGPCTELQLLQFFSEGEALNYFDMMFSLNDLCARGQAVRTQKKAGYLYEVTDVGREALALFGSRVPASLQTLLQETGESWKNRFLQEEQYPVSVRQTGRGEWELSLSVVEQEMEMLHISLALPTREMADALAGKWANKAGEVYETLFRLLSEDEK